MEFCKAFNAATQDQQGMIIPVVITVFADRSFKFITKTPPAAILLKKAAKIDKGSPEPNRDKVGKVSENDLKAASEWDLFTYYKEQMFRKTSTEKNPWIVINSENKMISRLNAMRYVLSHIDYAEKKKLRAKKWTREIPEYRITIDDVFFDNLTKEQYELLFSLQGHT